MLMQVISSVKSTAFIPDQQPSGMYYFNNFVGYMRSIILYQSLTGFPVVPGAIDTKITDSNVLFYY